MTARVDGVWGLQPHGSHTTINPITERGMLVLAIMEIVVLLVEISIGYKLVDEYRFILEYRRDARYFEDYKRKSRKQCMDIVENIENCDF